MRLASAHFGTPSLHACRSYSSAWGVGYRVQPDPSSISGVVARSHLPFSARGEWAFRTSTGTSTYCTVGADVGADVGRLFEFVSLCYPALGLQVACGHPIAPPGVRCLTPGSNRGARTPRLRATLVLRVMAQRVGGAGSCRSDDHGGWQPRLWGLLLGRNASGSMEGGALQSGIFPHGGGHSS